MLSPHKTPRLPISQLPNSNNNNNNNNSNSNSNPNRVQYKQCVSVKTRRP